MTRHECFESRAESFIADAPQPIELVEELFTGFN